ncbi:helix-turn-helix domain-containing protein [Sinorhizobium meliloti]|uniref:helix-turn-helix domain-containing protein n=1 Tax=Rhizobium meliloti TaxID=382 RepID=UPI000FDC91BF|nr:helix-turn-helix domain-containing protein [Sinorhizobium meliloti]RVI69347.1 helix-turn-helix domain-containing protein [Sinorhizobium meliloti]
MAKPPHDFPSVEEQALPWPKKAKQPTDDERKAFTAARLELMSFINRDFDGRMTPTVKLVASYLLESVNSETLLCFPSYRTILETLCIGKNEKTVERAIAVLRERGWLYVWRPDRTRSNRFVFLKNEQVVSQILDYQDHMRTIREEDRLERERTRMSVREIGIGTQMSVREPTPMSGKSFKVIHEPFSSIEREGYLIEGNSYAAVSTGDDAVQPFPTPRNDDEAESLLDAICAGTSTTGAIRRTLKLFLMGGTLSPQRAVNILGGEARTAA